MSLLRLPEAVTAFGARLKPYAAILARPVLAGLLVAVATIGLYVVLVDQEGQLIYRVVAAESARLRSEMLERLEARRVAMHDLASRWEVAKQPSRKAWEEDASRLLRPEFLFRAVQWIGPSLEVRWLVPAGARLSHAVLDSTHDELRHRELDAALGDPNASFTRSFPLPDAPRLILLSAPMDDGARITGYQVGVLRAHDVLDALLTDTVQRGFSVQVNEGSYHIYGPIWLESGNEAEWGSEQQLEIGDLDFRVTVWPSPELIRELRSWGPTLALVVGLLLAVFAGIAVHQVDRWKRRALVAGSMAGDAPVGEEPPPAPAGEAGEEDAPEEQLTPGPA